MSNQDTMKGEVITMKFPLPRILSIQSHVIHGYVGNKAVTFPLSCYGFHVDNINTITLSNKPGYNHGFKGSKLETSMFNDLIQGLQDNSLLNYDILMTG